MKKYLLILYNSSVDRISSKKISDYSCKYIVISQEFRKNKPSLNFKYVSKYNCDFYGNLNRNIFILV
jgi:hypothetical protein